MISFVGRISTVRNLLSKDAIKKEEEEDIRRNLSLL